MYMSRQSLIAPCEIWMKFMWVIFQVILNIDGWSVIDEIAFRWMSQGFTDYKSTLVQVSHMCIITHRVI